MLFDIRQTHTRLQVETTLLCRLHKFAYTLKFDGLGKFLQWRLQRIRLLQLALRLPSLIQLEIKDIALLSED
jgi:hypothetical protein